MLAKTICMMINIIVIPLNQFTFACHPTSLHTCRTIVHVLHLCTLVTPAHLAHLCTGYRGARFAMFAMFLSHHLRGRSKERLPRGPNAGLRSEWRRFSADTGNGAARLYYRLCVCLSPRCIVPKRLNGSSSFLIWRLPQRTAPLH